MTILLAKLDEIARKCLENLIKYYEIKEILEREGHRRRFSKNEYDKLKKEIKELREWLFSGWKRELIENLAKLKFDCCKANQLLNEVVRGGLSLGKTVISVYATLSHEGLVGVSSGVLHSVLEIGLGWDYVFDLPVIPGSAMKGAARRLALNLCVNLEDSEAKSRCFSSVVKLFGWVEKPSEDEVRELMALGFDKNGVHSIVENKVLGEGLITFYDAYPVADEHQCECYLLEPWVMTPHYGPEVEDEYDVVPIPLIHVVLKRGTTFKFIIMYDSSAEGYLKILMNYINRQLGVNVSDHSTFLAHLVAGALKQGVGARISKGYTSFDVERIVRYRGG